MTKVSMQDIADALGVSKGTVSLVLSGKAKNKRVSDALQEKIRAKAAEMKYHPNELARGLRTGQTKTIGIIVADISNKFFGQMCFFIQEKAKKYGYAAIIANTNESLDELDEAITLLIGRQVDGIILVPSDKSQERIRRIMNASIPLVLVDRFYEDIDVSHVVLDNYDAAKQITERLISSGCRRIAMVEHKNNMSFAIARRTGYEDSLKSARLFDPTLEKPIRFTREDADIEAAMRSLFFTTTSKAPDGIYFHSHELMLSSLNELARIGINVRQNLHIASFDYIDAFELAGFPLVYADQPVKEMGEKAVEILMSTMKDPSFRARCIFPATVSQVG
jgi:LacI family transcriptional regulator